MMSRFMLGELFRELFSALLVVLAVLFAVHGVPLLPWHVQQGIVLVSVLGFFGVYLWGVLH